MNEQAVVSLLGALSQETRLRIVRYLVSCGDEGATAGAIADEVGASSSRASFHLATLEKAGAAVSERRSRHIIYHANLGNLGAALSFMLNDCCGNNPDIRACCLDPKGCC